MPTTHEKILQKTEKLPEYNKILLLEFDSWLLNHENNSFRNATNYLKVLELFCRYLGEKKLKDVTEEDIFSFLNKRIKQREQDPDQKWIVTWNDYRNRLFSFYRWLYNKNDTLDRDYWKSPPLFTNIKQKKNKRISSFSPNDVWSQEEILVVVKYCTNTKYKALLTIMFDIAARNHEVTKLRIKDIVLKEKYGEATISWDTKTGMRVAPLIASFPYVRDLINDHPFKDNPNAFVFTSHNSGKPLKPDSLWTITKLIKKRISKLVADGMIHEDDKTMISNLLKKPWNPYLVGRHSSLTEKTNILSDHQLTKYAGWSPNTKRRATYIHMSGNEVKNPLLAHYGIEVPKGPKPVSKYCPKCSHVNPLESKYCQECSFTLDLNTWDELKKDEKKLETQMTNIQHELVFIRSFLTSRGLDYMIPHDTSEDVLLLAKEYKIPIDQR